MDTRGAFYCIELMKDGPNVTLSIDGLPLFSWTDDGNTGPLVGGGCIGFRQMAPSCGKEQETRGAGARIEIHY